MSIKHVVPMMVLLALPLAAQAQTAVGTEGSARVEARSEVNVQLARESVARETLARRSHAGKRTEPSTGEVGAGVEALAAGATRAELTRVRDAAPEGRDLSASLSALAELRAAGMGGGRAASQIASRLRSGASDRAITSFATDASAALDLRGSAGLGSAAGGLGAGLGAVGSVGGILR